MKEYYPEDTYITPTDTRTFPLDWLLFRSRWALYLKFARLVFADRKLALEGRYGYEPWHYGAYLTLKAIEGCGGRFSVSGFDNLRNLKKPVVFIANHMSTLETLILPALIVPFAKTTFVVKEKLLHGGFFGPIMRSRDPITVRRTDPREDLEAVLSGGKTRIDGGCSVIIFPQSTRQEVFRKRQFNSLGVKLALHAETDILPIAIKSDFWTNGKILSGFGKLSRKKTIHFAFGAPMTPNGRGKKEHQQTIDFITSHLKTWGAKIDHGEQK